MQTEREIFHQAIRRINKRRAERGEPSARYVIELDGRKIISQSNNSSGWDLLQCPVRPMIQCHRTCHTHRSASLQEIILRCLRLLKIR